MDVELDEPKCVAAGQFVLAAPDVFDVGVPPLERSREWGSDEDGVAVLLDDQPSPDILDGVRETAAPCPAAAIRLVER
ncbi:ferredoxin [Streptomyces phaeochromogenes]